MAFKRRRDKAGAAEPTAPDFQHSSGANTLEGLLGDHTLTPEAEMEVPKGYRARSIAKAEKAEKAEKRKAG
jgi:hypothetical protein